YVPIPKEWHYFDAGLGVFMVVGAIVLGIALLKRPSQGQPLPERGWRRRLAIFGEDLAGIGHSRYLPMAFVQSLPYLLIQGIPIWALFQLYEFDLPLRAAFGLMLILRLSSIVPQAPAGLGLFQFLTARFLERVYDIDPSDAARFSLVLWAAVKLPIFAAG